LAALTAALGGVRVTAATATHCHFDHTSGLAALREALGTRVWLAPSVAAPLAEPTAWRVPWLPAAPLLPDALLPEPGVWRWGGYELAVHHFPAQTWWHTSLCTVVDGRRVFFGGDNFQPPSRWNGTGGFCAMNGAHFRAGFAASAALVQQLRPAWIATGHGTYYRYQRQQFTKIARWAARAERAVRALCPSGSLEQDYYRHRLLPE
jgi:glyoxylase-like metal-dependent hydrolase (beta-lactamase superfamily II)